MVLFQSLKATCLILKPLKKVDFNKLKFDIFKAVKMYILIQLP
jgi:hypothetical protein